MQIRYFLSQKVTEVIVKILEIMAAGQLRLDLPLLSGFAYTISSLDFTVTLPGLIEAKPAFTSGYFKARIEENMQVEVKGNLVEGSVLVPLKDRETLTLELMVDETLFPPSPRPVWTAGTDDFAMIALAVLAVVVITGSDGKTTTTTLISEMLKASGKKVWP